MDSPTAQIFPLHARGRLVGVLAVGPTSSGRTLSGRRLNILTGIAQQAAIAVVNDQLYQESTERYRIEQELNVALSIQSSLIPSENPDIPGCDVAGYWQAARQVSGDFYDYMRFRDGRWGIAIADVADKGIPAALFMALSRTILRTVAFNRKDPAEVLHRTNEIIYNDTTSDHFVTVFYALWNPEDQSLHYANGGHNPPVLITAGGETGLLSSDGIALGVLRDISISEKSIKLNKGDCIVFYTDGVTETMNEDFDEFGLERLIIVTQDARSGTAEEIVSAIHSAIDDHAGSTPQFDDTTMVVIKR
jgi:sigma-B regulation protein RsbU (phosphoserine phosphatase)